MINKEFEIKNFQLENTNVCEIYSKNPKNINYCFTRPSSPPGARARAQDSERRNHVEFGDQLTKTIWRMQLSEEICNLHGKICLLKM